MGDERMVWVFNGENSNFPSGVFSSRERAEEWIRHHRLVGTLTAYPIDTGVYEWAMEHGYFKPKRDDQRTPEFIGRFSAAQQEHYHFSDGDKAEE